ncbi:MAG: hypothetical protein Pg6B_11030 [Candidatus Azobacteroides pseudotrichonymphae]|nr:MAG: hypothetical protein Ta2E_13020 [Mycoplasmoidaceae bacterium]GMO38776.1 MAG: hypothetical protein Pg6B_11030 [Candidatus Azobacteroides pseudotrichonymphae]
MCDFFNEHGVPFTSRWEYIPADETDPIETDWFHYYWTLQQEYIKYVKID